MKSFHSANKNSSYTKLVIISHTPHQLNSRLEPVGWGPTVNEINFLSAHWNSITHVACLEIEAPSGSSRPYASNNITFAPIPTFGGISLLAKLGILFKLPIILSVIHKSLVNATEVQLRLPMGIGLPIIIYFSLIKRRNFKLWVKFATNWGQRSSSISVRLQKYFLNKNILKCPVTINGSWPGQPLHCKSFENPCITQNQYDEGSIALLAKPKNPPFTLIFVGRLDADKGIDLVLNSIKDWPKALIRHIHFVGDGHLTESLRDTLESNSIPATLHGYLPQQDIFNLYKQCHFLVLPSKSEGFPKVVAEGLNFGCIPIVSRVGSVDHYIKNLETGILLQDLSSLDLTNAIMKALTLEPEHRQRMMHNGRLFARKFTFESYLNSLHNEVFL